jgi:CRISPR/Cas system Type II protein with McrA/HNH and RuvC-like nuclease domain
MGEWFLATTLLSFLEDKMNKDQIAFLKSFVKVFEKAKFDVTGPELLSIAIQIQNYSKIVIEMEKSLGSSPIPLNPVIAQPEVASKNKKEK